MKHRLIFAILLVVGTLATSVCRKSETDLEELPKDIAATLQRVPNSDMFISVPPVPTKAPPTKNQKTAAPAVKTLAPSCQSTHKYFIQVTYPVTVCSSVRDLSSVLTAYDAAMSPGSKSRTDIKTYKLSSFQGKPLLTSVFCHVRSGPWLATIVKVLNCSAQGSCQMSLGIPSSPVFLWGGQSCESQNRPQEVNYIEPLVEAGTSRSPCNPKNTCE
jgi:hypothetical protein